MWSNIATTRYYNIWLEKESSPVTDTITVTHAHHTIGQILTTINSQVILVLLSLSMSKITTL